MSVPQLRGPLPLRFHRRDGRWCVAGSKRLVVDPSLREHPPLDYDLSVSVSGEVIVLYPSGDEYEYDQKTGVITLRKKAA